MTAPQRSVFDLIYDSPWHHPMLCWMATPLVLFLLLQGRPRRDAKAKVQALWQLALAGQLLIALDALCTGSFSPFAPDSAASSVVAFLFVLVGDLRYFVLLERFSRPQAPRPMRVVGRALALAMLTPVTFQLLSMAVPAAFTEPRHKFLAYEVLFLLLLAAVRGILLPRRFAASGPSADDSAAQKRWLLRLTGFEAVQYGLWVLADILILAGERAGLLLRLVPNVLYYLVFVPLAYFSAPPSLRPTRRAI